MDLFLILKGGRGQATSAPPTQPQIMLFGPRRSAPMGTTTLNRSAMEGGNAQKARLLDRKPSQQGTYEEQDNRVNLKYQQPCALNYGIVNLTK